MLKVTILVLFLFSISHSGCTQVLCSALPESFTSYAEAVTEVQAATFKINEEITTYRSSWIKQASFYSCDGKKGFFIYKTRDNRTYIHKDVPIQKWEGFKSADSAGKYYHQELKGKYLILLN